MTTYDEKAVKQRYGRTPDSEEQVLAYLKALKIVIGADGEISPEEMDAFNRGMLRLGLPAETAQSIKDFDHTSTTLGEVLDTFKPGGRRARMLLYDCIHVSSSDGVYASEERSAVAQAAELLGIDKGLLQAIEALVDMERGVRHLHRAIFPRKG